MCKLGITRINIIGNDIVNRGCDYAALGDFRGEKQNIRTQEVFHIVHTENILYGNLRAAQVFINVQGISEHSNAGSRSMHLLKSVLYSADRHSDRHLKGGFLTGELTSQEKVIKLRQYFVLKLYFELLIGHADSSFKTISGDRLSRYGLSVFLKFNRGKFNGFHLILRQRNNIALGH